MSKLYDLLGSMIFKIKETEGAIPKKVSQLEQDVKVSWNDITGKPDISGGGGGGGVSSWNDLTDRPFGEETTPDQTITYDGSLDGYEYDEAMPGQYYVKLSDSTPEPEVFIGTTTKIYNNGQIQEFPVSLDSIINVSGAFIIGEAFILIPESGVWGLSAGIWGISQITDGEAMVYSAELTIPGTTVIHTIDPKYLPDSVKLTVTTTEKFRIEYDGNPDGREKVETDEYVYLKVSDETPAPEEWIGGTITATASGSGNVATMEVTSDSIDIIEDGLYEVANTFRVRYAGDALDGIWIIFPTSLWEQTKSHSVVFEGLQETTVTKIDPKYLPDLPQGEGTSFTPGETVMLTDGVLDVNLDAVTQAVIDALPTAEGGNF